jgi:LacI family transcriptional regulator
MIEEHKTPYVLIDRRFQGLNANFVGVDDESVGVLATSHLIEQGCRRVAHIRGPEVSTAIGRLEGYKRVLASYNMTPLPGHVVSLGTSGDHRGENGGYEAAKRLLATELRPDGIFCFNDPSALGAMRAILDAGLRIPQDIAVIGCGNLSYSDFLRVPLSSVDQGSENIGKSAAELALKIARKKDASRPKSELITPRLVIRASSQRFPPV